MMALHGFFLRRGSGQHPLASFVDGRRGWRVLPLCFMEPRSRCSGLIVKHYCFQAV